MARRFRGESVHKVDSKGRVSIPAPFRRVLEDGDPDWVSGAQPNLVLVYGLRGRPCLEGYSLKGIEEVDDMISALPRYSPEREALERMINTQSIYAQVDENGRMVLPAKLRERIGVKAEATFAGMGDKFQIWEPSAYEDDMNRIGDWLGDKDQEQDIFALLDRARLNA
ncbi:division/cell wall cluster transcriptional repressor MraZ [Rhodobacteraceae bacterium 2CG4]|uniref:Transcriptional regulator MraZ n=1 Tax=Halovulum marinum TaxID=2662447 RepID=A0A6L5Z164_9RHOB|nr:division/cell wall cluster transcriptional repressor MraZ [Halovulum marinum]MSU89800.1 division/cell wall cluster transcriptional repressor MraZ [Halovulum marinum]